MRVEIVEGMVRDELQEPAETMTTASEDKVDNWDEDARQGPMSARHYRAGF